MVISETISFLSQPLRVFLPANCSISSNFNCDFSKFYRCGHKLKEELENSKQEVKDLKEEKDLVTERFTVNTVNMAHMALKDKEINMLNRRLEKNKS